MFDRIIERKRSVTLAFILFEQITILFPTIINILRYSYKIQTYSVRVRFYLQVSTAFAFQAPTGIGFEYVPPSEDTARDMIDSIANRYIMLANDTSNSKIFSTRQ